MVRIIGFLSALLLSSAAFAQQQQAAAPTEMALQINGVVSAWAVTLEQQRRLLDAANMKNADLQKQLDAANSRVKDLEAGPAGKMPE